MREVVVNGETFYVFQDVCASEGLKVQFADVRKVDERHKRCVRLDSGRVRKDNFVVLNAAGVAELVEAARRPVAVIQDKEDMGMEALVSAANLVVAGVEIRQDAFGRYCLNDFHRAAGGEEKHGPGRWLRTDGCKSLIKLIKPKMAYSPIEATPQVGTFAVKQLVYAYAMWVSAEFHLKVIDTFDAVVTGQISHPAAMTKMQILELAMQSEKERMLLAEKVGVLEPKAEIADRIYTAEGLFGFRQAAKVLNVLENKFRDFLIQNDWVYYLGKRLTGKHYPIKAGYIVERIKLIQVVGEDDKSIKAMFFTAKGLHKLAQHFNTVLDQGEVQ